MASNNIQIKNALFINAGAGTGKTYRLTNDLADFLSGSDNNGHNSQMAQIKPSEVIATTFTKVAAAEIKERARQELLKKGNVKDAAQLDASAIGTIHSVAQQFLNKYWYLLGSCPNQEVITDEDKSIYRNQSLGQLFNDNAFVTERKAIQNYFKEFQPTKWENNRNVLDINFWADHVDRIVGKATYYGITDFKGSIIKSYEEIDRVFNNDQSPCIKSFEDAIGNIILYLDDAIAATNNARSKASLEKKRDTLTELKGNYHVSDNNPGNVAYESLIEAYNLAKDFSCVGLNTIGILLSSKFFGNILKECVEAVFTIAKAWMDEYENFKRRLGVIDYDDMEKGFNRLLDIAEVQEEIRSTYKLVMVDEFQDCNPMQLKIFSKLSEIVADNSTLPYSSIWVGDPNQSIYGFRGSDTDLINRVKALFSAKYPNKNAEGMSIDSLDTSYRSCDQLVDYANKVFKSPFFKEYTELRHNPNAVSRDAGNAAVLQWNFKKADSYDGNNLHSFALHLKDIVENYKYQIQQKGTNELRNIDYKDIAILARRNDELKKIVEVLREEGVPASAPESDILDRAEVQLVLAILNLRGSKKDGAMGERPHELATLLRLWNDMTTENVLSERVDVVNSGADWSSQHSTDINPIRVALDHTKNLPLDEKVATIILELDLYDKVAKWGEAEVRRQNLMTLQSVAKQFVARCSRLGIAPIEKEFTLYLQEAAIKAEKDNTSNSVRVFTYHGSKGLEWPMVILYSLDDDSLKLDETNGGEPLNKFFVREYFGVHEVMISDESGLERDYYIHYFPAPVASAITPLRATIVASTVYSNAKIRQTEESKRLFYVGVTRARDYLVYYATPTFNKSDGCYKLEWEGNFCWLHTMGLTEDSINPRRIVDFEPLVRPTLKKVNEPGPRAKEETRRKYEDYLNSVNEHDSDQVKEDMRRKALNAPKAYNVHDLQPLAENSSEAKYLHPSQLAKGNFEVKSEYTFVKLDGAERIEIPETNANGEPLHYRKDAFGSCIHNIFAACPYDGKRDLTEDELNAYYGVAHTIIGNYRLEHVITDVKALVNNLMAMFEWLKNNYGAPTAIVHEFPFNYPYGQDDAQVVRGEIDLVYGTEKTDVIIDFKNFMGDKEWLERRVKDHEYHFVGTHYVAQLSMYRNIWQKAHADKDIATYLYYDILGGVIEL